MTQAALSERVGMSPQYLRRVESGTANMTLRSLHKFARALGVEEMALLERPTTRRRRSPGRPPKASS